MFQGHRTTDALKRSQEHRPDCSFLATYDTVQIPFGTREPVLLTIRDVKSRTSGSARHQRDG